MRKVNIIQARKVFRQGHIVRLCPNKWYPMKPNVYGSLSVDIKLRKYQFEGDYIATDFDKLVNNYKYYNCSYETGYRVSFYVDMIEGLEV